MNDAQTPDASTSADAAEVQRLTGQPSRHDSPNVDELVIAILYPSEWYGPSERFDDEIRRLEELDARIEVVVEPYIEPAELRTARGRGDTAQLAALMPALTPAQRDTLARAEIAVTLDLPSDIASVAPRLRWVQAVGAGIDQLRSAGLADAGIRLTSNGGSNATAIAEFVLGRILQHTKRFRELDEAQHRREWAPLFGRELAGRTLGLIGYGAINQRVAALARAIGMRTLATRRSPSPEPTADVDEFFTPDGLTAMLEAADIVVAAAPDTPETTGMVGAAELAAMGPRALFVNVGRGSLVNEAALVEALQTGTLAAAALDVTSVEPLPAEHPLWDAPNLYLSGHCASSPATMFPHVHRVFLENLRRYLAGEPLEYEVDLERGY